MLGKRVQQGLAVVGAAALLVIGFDTVTYAATGSSLILGRANSAGATTVVSNTGVGPALDLRVASPLTPPLRVGSSAVVPNLHAANSDRLAGVGASGYQRRCQNGSVLARAGISPTAAGWHVNSSGGYVCSGGTVDVNWVGTGVYRVRFGYSHTSTSSGLSGIPMAQLDPFFCAGTRITAYQRVDNTVTPAMNYVGVEIVDAAGTHQDCLFSIALV